MTRTSGSARRAVVYSKDAVNGHPNSTRSVSHLFDFVSSESLNSLAVPHLLWLAVSILVPSRGE